MDRPALPAASMRACALALALPLAALPACSGGGSSDSGNVLPTTTGASSGGSGSAASSGGTGAMGNSFPATYRFSCVDIQALGDAGPDAFQAQLLEGQWNQDIADWKLNILIDVLEREDMGAATTMKIRSGVGTGPTEMCSEPTTESTEKSGTYDAGQAAFGPHPDPAGAEACSQASTDPMGGSYTLTTDAMDVVYIYSEDNDGTKFNCTADAGTPDAVPIRNISATFTQDPDGTTIWGSLTGCLLEAEAEALCSCLGACGGSPNADCAGCPDGSVPLRTLLGNIGTSTGCSDALGAPAFDITLGFTASLLPAVPGTCG